MLYLAPAEDPEEADYQLPFSQNEFRIPQRENDEFKGFQRKLQEMELWKQLFTGTLAAAFLSIFDATDIEIYWPLLLGYFIMMTLFLCRFKIEHMIRYKYIPFDFGKTKY
jgi:hypothetical protein